MTTLNFRLSWFSAHGEVYSIQHYVIEFVSSFLRVPSTNKTDITEILLKVSLSTINHHQPPPATLKFRSALQFSTDRVNMFDQSNYMIGCALYVIDLSLKWSYCSYSNSFFGGGNQLINNIVSVCAVYPLMFYLQLQQPCWVTNGIIGCNCESRHSKNDINSEQRWLKKAPRFQRKRFLHSLHRMDGR